MRIVEVVNIKDDSKNWILFKSILKLIGIFLLIGTIGFYLVDLTENQGLHEYFKIKFIALFGMIIGIYFGMCYQKSKQETITE